MTEPASDGGPPWFSASLARGLSVIRAFSADAPRLRISEVAARSNMTRAAARRFLLTLAELGYVGQDGDQFFLRPRILDLGYSYVSSARLEETVGPILEALSETTGTSAHIAVLDNDCALFIATTYSERMHGHFTAVGARRPAYAGSLGKVLLAGLTSEEFDAYLARTEFETPTPATISSASALRGEIAKVRERGYALNQGEFIPGIMGLAVSLRDRAGEVVAALNCSWLSSVPIQADDLERLLPVLRTAVSDIETFVLTGRLQFGPSTKDVSAPKSRERSK